MTTIITIGNLQNEAIIHPTGEIVLEVCITAQPPDYSQQDFEHDLVQLLAFASRMHPPIRLRFPHGKAGLYILPDWFRMQCDALGIGIETNRDGKELPERKPPGAGTRKITKDPNECWDYHIISDIEVTVAHKTNYLAAWIKQDEVRLHSDRTPPLGENNECSGSIGVIAPSELAKVGGFIDEVMKYQSLSIKNGPC